MFCICARFVEDSRPIDFGEDRLRERGSLPVTFYVLTRVLLPYSLRNGSMVMAKKIVFEIIADSDCTTLKTWKKSLFEKCLCVCLSVDFFSMANDNCRKFKQNQIMFRIQPSICLLYTSPPNLLSFHKKKKNQNWPYTIPDSQPICSPLHAYWVAFSKYWVHILIIVLKTNSLFKIHKRYLSHFISFLHLLKSNQVQIQNKLNKSNWNHVNFYLPRGI